LRPRSALRVEPRLHAGYNQAVLSAGFEPVSYQLDVKPFPHIGVPFASRYFAVGLK
jgi:hypothetical protein